MTDKHRDQQSSVQTAHDKSVQKYVVQRLLWHNTGNTQEQLEWADWWISVVFKPSQLWQLHLGEDEKEGGGGGKEWGRKRERQGERKRGEKEGRRDRERRRTERGWERDGERIGRDTERGGGGSGGRESETETEREEKKFQQTKWPSNMGFFFFFIFLPNILAKEEEKLLTWFFKLV